MIANEGEFAFTPRSNCVRIASLDAMEDNTSFVEDAEMELTSSDGAGDAADAPHASPTVLSAQATQELEQTTWSTRVFREAADIARSLTASLLRPMWRR